MLVRPRGGRSVGFDAHIFLKLIPPGHIGIDGEIHFPVNDGS